MTVDCSQCGEAESDYSSPYCAYCGNLLGWPNYRKALSEQIDLRSRFGAALADIQARGLERLAHELQSLIDRAQPVINMDCEACDSLLRNEKYRSYHRRVEIGDRFVASETNHADRTGINARIYPRYGHHLHYAVLSPDESGIPTYGEVAVRWRVGPHYVGQRATLLEENEYTFFERHELGKRGAIVPAGYRAIWDDRFMLLLAKVATALSPTTAISELSKLLLEKGASRNDANYLEVVIYDENGVDGRDVESVHMDRLITDPQKQRRWEIIVESCHARGIAVI